MKEKTYTVYTRKVTKDILRSLKRLSNAQRQSMNSFVLNLFDAATANERKEFKNSKIKKQQ